LGRWGRVRLNFICAADGPAPPLPTLLFGAAGVPGGARTGSGYRRPYRGAPDKKTALEDAAGNIFLSDAPKLLWGTGDAIILRDEDALSRSWIPDVKLSFGRKRLANRKHVCVRA
jgi:hypothetical protein